jgi:hypothetical protein
MALKAALNTMIEQSNVLNGDSERMLIVYDNNIE